MLSLKWGDFLSMLLPGTVVLFALRVWFPELNNRVHDLKNVGVAEGFAFMIAAAVIGGVLEAFTRVTWEKHVLVKFCPSIDVLPLLRSTNLDLYERGVQSSYKYSTFFANLTWATIILAISQLVRGGTKPCSLFTILSISIVALMLRASYLQWTYYVNYQTKVFGGKSDAEKRPTTGNESAPVAGSSEGKGV